jgi:hypothetical protein
MNCSRATFVINLKHRADRRAEMEKELSRVDWKAEFFPAIRPESAADFPSIGTRGCFLSHLEILKIARDANMDRLIILEDDVNFVPNFATLWRVAISLLKAEKWSMFYPGHVLRGLPPGLSRLAPCTGVLCTHFLMINGSAIPILIKGLETILSRRVGHPLGGPMHVDGAYSTIRRQNPSLETYAYWPVLGYQRPSRTDVGRLKWFDRVSMLAQIVHVGRKIKAYASRKT